jgi:hypothetical protein
VEFRAAGGLRASPSAIPSAEAEALKFRGLIVIEGNGISHHKASQHHSYGASFTPATRLDRCAVLLAVSRGGDGAQQAGTRHQRSGLFAASSYHRVPPSSPTVL